MINRLFSHNSSDEDTPDQWNNEQFIHQQPNRSEDQRNKDPAKHETGYESGICAAYERNCPRFEVWVNTKNMEAKWQHQRRFNSDWQNITAYNHSLNKCLRKVSIVDLKQVVFSVYWEVIKRKRNLFVFPLEKTDKNYFLERTIL